MAITAGIDNGTQSTKVLIYDSVSMKVLSLTQAPHDLVSRSDGSREQEAKWWIKALTECFSAVPQSLRNMIQAVGVSGQQHGFVPVAGDGTVLAPVKIWCDTSTQSECDEITQSLGGRENVISLTGNEIKAGYTASKILHFRKSRPDAYSRMAWIMLPHDYINYYLTREPVMEAGDASGTAFFNIRTKTWSSEVLKAIDGERDLSACLPRLIGHDESAGTVCHAAAVSLGIPEGIPVSCGGGDNMMGAIGTGTVYDGDLAMSMGTSGTLYGISGNPVVDKHGRLASFCSSTGKWLPLLCTMNCTVSSEVTRSFFSRDVNAFNEIAARAPIGCCGVSMLPYFNGERTPNYPNGRGCIFGLNLENMTEENISRSAMEASVFAMKYGLDAFAELGFSPRSVALTGGGAKSPLWRQMVSDVTGLEVRIPENPEAAAFGAAIQSLALIENETVESLSKKHCRTSGSNSPDAENNAKYSAVYEKWLGYVKSVEPLFS